MSLEKEKSPELELRKADTSAKVEVLREAALDLSWLGAQGNLVEPDRAWAGVTACMEALRSKADRLEQDQAQ